MRGGLFSFLGGSRSDEAGISVPAMDGVLKPNMALEHSDLVATLPGIDDLAVSDGAVAASAGNVLYLVAHEGEGHNKPASLAVFDGNIGFVAALEEGRYVVGVLGEGLKVGAPGDFRHLDLPSNLVACMTAGAVLPDGRLAVCVGSSRNPASEWKRDLMERGRTGQVCIVDLETGEHQIAADGLAFPYGVVVETHDRLLVAESWRHRIVGLNLLGNGRVDPVLEDLPAYPARLAAALDGGFWLTLFAPRRQLFEFVLREDDFRRDMMASIPPEEWVGPSLNASGRYDHPLQQGSVRQMGVVKPWAPSSSYGLVVKCNARMHPVRSWHSRADGRMHGVTGICETNQGGFAAVKGAGTLVRLDSRREEI